MRLVFVNTMNIRLEWKMSLRSAASSRSRAPRNDKGDLISKVVLGYKGSAIC